MKEMIERVARAQHHEDTARNDVAWVDLGALQVEAYTRTARAAIEAMREPTEAMMLAACHAGNEDMEASWRAAVDEALR